MKRLIRHQIPVALASGEVRKVAGVVEFLASLTHGGTRKAPNCILEGPDGQRVALPATLLLVLERAANVLASGASLAVVPVRRELSTQQAADLLNVSLQYLLRLLDEGRIPETRPGKRRQILTTDVLAFKATRDRERKRAVRELSRLTAEFGGYQRELK